MPNPRKSPATPASARGRGRTIEEFDMSKGSNSRSHNRAIVQRHDAAFESRTKALASLPPVVYAVRVGKTVKIGFSTEMHNRLRKYGAGAEILGFAPGTLADEKALHASLAAHRAHGNEWYHPAPEVLAVVNEMRESLGLPLLAA